MPSNLISTLNFTNMNRDQKAHEINKDGKKVRISSKSKSKLD